jgi:hypothetical protein
MSSFRSYFSSKKKYQKQSDLINLSAVEIVNLNPLEIDANIDKNTGGAFLDGVKKRAMYRLLAIKNMSKQNPSEELRQKSINDFLVREGLKNDADVDKLIADTQSEIDNDNTQKLNKSLPYAPSNTPLPKAPTTSINRGGKSRNRKKSKKSNKSKKAKSKKNKKAKSKKNKTIKRKK